MHDHKNLPCSFDSYNKHLTNIKQKLFFWIIGAKFYVYLTRASNRSYYFKIRKLIFILFFKETCCVKYLNTYYERCKFKINFRISPYKILVPLKICKDRDRIFKYLKILVLILKKRL